MKKEGGILHSQTTAFSVSCHENAYSLISDGERIVIDLEGNEIARAPFGTTIPISPEMKKEYSFYNREDELTRRVVKVGKKANEDRRSYQYIIINDKGNNIMPSSFSIPQNYTNSYNGRNGGFRVHDQSANRSGVIDFDGNWLIEPMPGFFGLIGKELYVYHLDVERGVMIYDRNGQLISDSGYQYIEEDRNAQIHNDRITVGYLLNEKNFKATVERLAKIEDFREYLKANAEAEKGEYLFGYINRKGDEIIAPKYIHADPFTYAYTTVTKLEADGQLISSLIDLSGKEIFSGPYDNLEIFRSDTSLLKASKSGKFGIVDNAGKVVVPVEHAEISLVDQIAVTMDSTGLYFIDQDSGKKKKIGEGGDKYFIQKISNGYYLATVTTLSDVPPRSLQTYFAFSQDGKELGNFTTHFYNRSSTLKGNPEVALPKGVVQLIPNYKNLKSYYLNLDSGKVYWGGLGHHEG